MPMFICIYIHIMYIYKLYIIYIYTLLHAALYHNLRACTTSRHIPICIYLPQFVLALFSFCISRCSALTIFSNAFCCLYSFSSLYLQRGVCCGEVAPKHQQLQLCRGIRAALHCWATFLLNLIRFSACIIAWFSCHCHRQRHRRLNIHM